MNNKKIEEKINVAFILYILMYCNKNLNDKVFWDEIIMETFQLDSNIVSLDTLKNKLKKDKILKGNYIRLNNNIRKLLNTNKHKTCSRMRTNIFLAYLLSNYSVNNETPNCYYCSYNKDFNEISSGDLNKILNTLEV